MISRELVSSARSLALPILVALVLDLLFYTGFYAGDDSQYLIAAQAILGGRDVPISPASVRLGLVLPLALLHALAGGHIELVIPAFVVAHPVLVVLAHALGRMTHGDTEARIASFLIAICPFLYLFAGAILPDLIAAAWLSLSLLLLLLARDHRARWFVAAAGATLGIAYTVQETALVMIAPAAVLLTLDRDKRKLIPYYLGGSAAIFLIETLLLRWFTGEWILHLRMLSHSEPSTSHLFSGMIEIGPLWIWIITVSSIAYARLAGKPWPILLHSVWAFAFLAFGASTQSHHLAMVLVPAAVVAAHVIVRAGERLPPRARAPMLVLLLTALAIREVERNLPRAGDLYSAYSARGLEDGYRAVVRDHPSLRIALAPGYAHDFAPLMPNAPSRVTQLSSWDPGACPTPPFALIELGARYDEAKVNQLIASHPRAIIETLDVIYPRKRISRLFDALRSYYVVGPRPAPGTWSRPETETVVLLIRTEDETR